MKILYIVPSYEPAWAFGGTVTSVSRFCRALAAQGIDITVYTTDADGNGSRLKVPLNVPVDIGRVKVWYFPCDFSLKRAFYSKALAKKLAATVEDFDLIHVSAIWQLMQRDVYKTCRLFNKPYIVSPHGSFSPWSWKQKNLKKKIYWHLYGMKSVMNATALRFTTEDERTNAFVTLPMLAKIPSFIVPNGIDLTKINREKNVRAGLNIPEDKLLLLFIGRIHPVKGIDFVLNALKKINNEKFVLLIVGNKDDKNYAQYLQKLSAGINNKIIWHEMVERKDVWSFYYSADLFVLPSYHENFGMVVIEAMACGLPVLISKNVGIWREVGESKSGFVVEQNVDAIAKVLGNISNSSSELSRMSENAKRTAEERYNIETVTSLILKAYNDILNGTKSKELFWE